MEQKPKGAVRCIIGGQEFVIDPYKEPLVQLKGAIKGYMRGTLPYAVSDGKLPCALCDPLVTFDCLAHHLLRAHGLSKADYYEHVGLMRSTSLTSIPYQRARQAGMSAERIEHMRTVGKSRRGVAPKKTRSYGTTPEHLNKNGVCRDQIIAVARAIASKNDGVITGSLLMEQGINPDKVIRRFFPSIHALAETVGARSFRRGWTDSEMLSAFRSLAIRLGRTPAEDDLGPTNLTPGPDVYRKRFGTKADICRLTGLPPVVAAPLTFGDNRDILQRYSVGAGVVDLSRSLHRGTEAIGTVLTKYGVAYGPGLTEPQRREARAFAATMARRLAGLPDEEIE